MKSMAIYRFITLMSIYLLMELSSAYGYTLSGLVYGNSVLLSGVNVSLLNNSSTQIASITTETDGKFSFNLVDGVYSLQLTPNSSSNLSASRVNGINIDGNNVEQNIVLISGTNVLSGTISTYEGVAVQNASIRAYSDSNPNASVSTNTDSNGFYSVSLSAGTYRLIINGIDSNTIPGLGGSWYTEMFVTNISVNGNIVQNASLPQFVTVNGKVTDKNGTAVSGAGVSLSSRGYASVTGALNSSFTTDVSGNFTAKAVVSGGYQLVLTPPTNNTQLASTTINLNVTGDENQTFQFQENSQLNGKITTFEGKAVSGASIRAYSDSNPNASASTTTDKDGNYVVYVVPGTYRLIINGIDSNTIPGLGGS